MTVYRYYKGRDRSMGNLESASNCSDCGAVDTIQVADALVSMSMSVYLSLLGFNFIPKPGCSDKISTQIHNTIACCTCTVAWTTGIIFEVRRDLRELSC